MSCPRNNFGHPACFITSHPDYPQEKFCVTCRQRFYQNQWISPPPPESDSSSKGIFVLVITALMLVILFKALPEESPPSNPINLNNGDQYPHLKLQQSKKQDNRQKLLCSSLLF